MKKILVAILILVITIEYLLIFGKINNIRANEINSKDNLSLCSNCLIITQYPTPNPFNSYNSYTTMKFKVTTSQYLTIYIVNMYHDLGWFTYTNCSGAADGVGYCKEIVKVVFPRQWINANIEYSVIWTGNTESGNGWITKGVYYFQFVFSNSNCITENIPVGVTFSLYNNRERYVEQAYSWLDIPYSLGHVSRERTISCSYRGVDCTGFVLGVAREMGFNINYPEMLAGWMYNNYGSCSNITSGCLLYTSPSPRDS